MFFDYIKSICESGLRIRSLSHDVEVDLLLWYLGDLLHCGLYITGEIMINRSVMIH